MQQIERAVVTSSNNRLVASNKSVVADIPVEPGNTYFGLSKKIKADLSVGSSTPWGEVANLTDDKVALLQGKAVKEYDRDLVEHISSKNKFIVKEPLTKEIGRYHLLYMLQHPTADHGLSTTKTLQSFVDELKDFLLSYVRKMDDDLFMQPSNIQRRYDSDDINRVNLEAGKRYKKLVFIRQIGTVITKMYFPSETILTIGALWGYDNHSSVIHGRNVIKDMLEVDKQMTEQILGVVNAIR